MVGMPVCVCVCVCVCVLGVLNVVGVLMSVVCTGMSGSMSEK